MKLLGPEYDNGPASLHKPPGKSQHRNTIGRMQNQDIRVRPPFPLKRDVAVPREKALCWLSGRLTDHGGLPGHGELYRESLIPFGRPALVRRNARDPAVVGTACSPLVGLLLHRPRAIIGGLAAACSVAISFEQLRSVGGRQLPGTVASRAVLRVIFLQTLSNSSTGGTFFTSKLRVFLRRSTQGPSLGGR